MSTCSSPSPRPLHSPHSGAPRCRVYRGRTTRRYSMHMHPLPLAQEHASSHAFSAPRVLFLLFGILPLMHIHSPPLAYGGSTRTWRLSICRRRTPRRAAGEVRSPDRLSELLWCIRRFVIRLGCLGFGCPLLGFSSRWSIWFAFTLSRPRALFDRDCGGRRKTARRHARHGSGLVGPQRDKSKNMEFRQGSIGG